MKNQPLHHNPILRALLRKGVRIPNPESIEIGEDVRPDRISGNGVVIHSGCKLFGSKTLILANTRIGYEAPTTVDNCQIGPDVKLDGGFFHEAVFLEGARMGSGAHVREGTILEEHASGAHTVGLKQTILFPFVTLGSLINFCDCLMAGGTSRKNHSEVGSSFIHFNFTPSQDKATPSLFGDAPSGVMLNRTSVFLGGQGGVVGPCRLTYGCVTAAGAICRRDELRPDRLIVDSPGKPLNIPHAPGTYRNLKAIVEKNLFYIANLIALKQWYGLVRSRFVNELFPEEMLIALLEKNDLNITERIRRLRAFVENLPDGTAMRPGESGNDALRRERMREVRERFPLIEEALNKNRNQTGDTRERELFLEDVDAGIGIHGPRYIDVIARLEPGVADSGTKWLNGIVNVVMSDSLKTIPSFSRSGS